MEKEKEFDIVDTLFYVAVGMAFLSFFIYNLFEVFMLAGSFWIVVSIAQRRISPIVCLSAMLIVLTYLSSLPYILLSL